MKKIFTWLFRDSLELHKHWWHRLIKVVFISLFSLIVLGSFIASMFSPERSFFMEHNIHINNSLYGFTENYEGKDYENTIPKFFEQDGYFGTLEKGKLGYVSEYTLGNSICIKTPEKYLDGISEILYKDYINKTGTLSKSDFVARANEIFSEDTTRKCYLFDINKYDKEIIKIENLSKHIINYEPNIVYYLEITIAQILIAVISFLFFALVYYRLILYIAFGNKK